MRSLCKIPHFQAAIHCHFPALRFVLTSRLSQVSGVSGAALAPAREVRDVAGHIGHTTSINWLQLMSGEV
jgi:hypothetical protein